MPTPDYIQMLPVWYLLQYHLHIAASLNHLIFRNTETMGYETNGKKDLTNLCQICWADTCLKRRKTAERIEPSRKDRAQNRKEENAEEHTMRIAPAACAEQTERKALNGDCHPSYNDWREPRRENRAKTSFVRPLRSVLDEIVQPLGENGGVSFNPSIFV